MQTSRFFRVDPDQSSGFTCVLMPDNDILLLDVFRNGTTQSVEVYRDDDMVIVSVLLTDQTIDAIREFAEADKPLSAEAVAELGLTSSFCGKEYSAVPYDGLFWYFPELAGQEVVGQDEDGNDILVDKVRRVKWSGENAG